MNNEYDWTTDEFYDFIKDSHFINYNIEKIIPDTGRFMSTYATLTTHGTYTPRGSNLDNYKKLTSSTNSTQLKNLLDNMEISGYYPRKILSSFLYYKAAMMDLDKTIKAIFDRLETTNNLDKTTVVIYSDHNAYYDNLSSVLRGVDTSNTYKCHVSTYNMSCIIYDQKLTAKYKNEATYTNGTQNPKFMSVNDIYPTICDILGLKWNTSISFGKSIFSDEPSVFISFKDNGYIFDNNYYLYDNKIIKVNKDAKDKTYFKEESDKIIYKFNMLEKLHKNLNIWKKMFTN